MSQYICPVGTIAFCLIAPGMEKLVCGGDPFQKSIGFLLELNELLWLSIFMHVFITLFFFHEMIFC